MAAEDESKPLGADPYKHQPDSEWKQEQLRGDQAMLVRLFQISPDAVRAATANYVGHEHILFRFLFSLRFLERAIQQELTEKATTLKIAVAIFTIEGIAPPTLGNRERVKAFLAKYLLREDKIRLLTGFTFSEATALGQSPRITRHIMLENAVNDTAFRKQNYFLEEPKDCPGCFCYRWLNEQGNDVLDELIQEFGNRLYTMRCAVVHDATQVFFGSDLEKPTDVPLWSATLLDVYTDQERKYVTYRSNLLIDDILQMLQRGFKNCFEKGPWV